MVVSEHVLGWPSVCSEFLSVRLWTKRVEVWSGNKHKHDLWAFFAVPPTTTKQPRFLVTFPKDYATKAQADLIANDLLALVKSWNDSLSSITIALTLESFPRVKGLMARYLEALADRHGAFDSLPSPTLVLTGTDSKASEFICQVQSLDRSAAPTQISVVMRLTL